MVRFLLGERTSELSTMSGKSNSDIDLIWSSLKNEDVIFADVSGISNSFAEKPRRRDKNASQRFAIENLGRPFDIDAVPNDDFGEEHGRNNKAEQDRGKASKDTSNCSDLFCGLAINETSIGPVDGDSDDEDENGKENFPPQCHLSNPAWRIERVAKVLGSDDISSRVLSLTELKDAIDTLLQHRPVPPRLNYPPPYDDGQIKLNQNLPLVSDFSKPKPSQSTEARPFKAPEGPCVGKHDDSSEARDRLQAILNVCGNSLFRLIGDGKSEKCRVLSLECLKSLLLSGIDLGRHIPYMIPALCARYLSCTYDKDMEVFVRNLQSHEFYKRGGATDRQDRGGLFRQGEAAFRVVEPNEELRLDLCRSFDCLLRGVLAAGAERTLDAYYSEIVFSLQAGLGDPFPEVKLKACRLLVQLLRVPYWEQGAKYFATGLARSALPNCRHRNTNVIIAAMDLFEASVCVPDRAKVKGAGTAAIADLVGFREENVSR